MCLSCCTVGLFCLFVYGQQQQQQKRQKQKQTVEYLLLAVFFCSCLYRGTNRRNAEPSGKSTPALHQLSLAEAGITFICQGSRAEPGRAGRSRAGQLVCIGGKTLAISIGTRFYILRFSLEPVRIHIHSHIHICSHIHSHINVHIHVHASACDICMPFTFHGR